MGLHDRVRRLVAAAGPAGCPGCGRPPGPADAGAGSQGGSGSDGPTTHRVVRDVSAVLVAVAAHAGVRWPPARCRGCGRPADGLPGLLAHATDAELRHLVDLTEPGVRG